MALVIVTATKAAPTSFTVRTDSVDRTTVRVTTRADGGIGTCSFVIDGSDVFPEDVVKVELDGSLMFRGRVVNRSRTIGGNVSQTARRRLRIVAADSNRWLDKSIWHASVPPVSITGTDKSVVTTILDNGGEGTRDVTAGAEIRQYNASTSFDGTRFFLKTKRVAIQEVSNEARAWDPASLFRIPFFYVDVSDAFHWAFDESDVRTMAWDFSDAPDGSTTYGYWNLDFSDDTSGLVTYWVRNDAGTVNHYANSPADPSGYGRLEAVAGSGGIYELSYTPYPVTTGRLLTFKKITAGDYVKVYNQAWGDPTTKELLNAEGTAVMGLMRATAVTLSFENEFRPVYEVTLVGAAPSLAGFLR